jgi:serine/threonine protein kinase
MSEPTISSSLADFSKTEKLHSGKYFVIYRSVRKDDGLPVVLKMLKDQYPSPEQLARFQREYDLIRKLESEYIIKAYSLVRSQKTSIIVLEDFGGEPLKKTMATLRNDIHLFLRLAIKVADGLGQIHRNNIIHKDINPSNILWNPTDNVLKIIDFSLSTELSREYPEVFNPNVLVGTLPYISPEQTGRMNRPMDYRTDMYSLGVTLFSGGNIV